MKLAKAIFELVSALATLCALVYGVVSAVGAASHDRWDQATFWLVFLILLNIHTKDNK